MELYIVRHGTTSWNAERRFQGVQDIELNSQGRELAGKLGVKLDNTSFDVIYSSPLIRAYETACLIRGHRNIQIIRHENLREISFGELEGLPFKDWMNTEEPRKYFFTEPGRYVPPKGGETFESACERTKKFVQTEIEPLYGKYERVMIVAHGALLASLMCYLENRTVENFWGKGLKGNCEETIYSYDGKNWSLKMESETPQPNNYMEDVEK